MIGALIGDVVGSVYEFNNIKSKNFPFFSGESCFTDDSVMTLAVAESLMRCDDRNGNYDSLSECAIETLQDVGRNYPNCGYGAKFIHWMFCKNPVPYNSCGNGSAMRISAVGDIAESVEEAKDLSYKVTCISHNHPEGIKGAEAVAVAKVLFKEGVSKEDVRKYIEDNYYKLDMTVDEYRKYLNGHGKEICQLSVPQAFVCLFEGKDFEDVIRNCISIGGDSDTIGAIAGGMAEAVYKIPEWMIGRVRTVYDDYLIDIIDRWEKFSGVK